MLKRDQISENNDIADTDEMMVVIVDAIIQFFIMLVALLTG